MRISDWSSDVCSSDLILGQRPGLWFAGIDTDMRRDARQHLVAGDQQVEVRCVQAGMFRRMAAADDHLPVVVADADRAALDDAVEGARDRRYRLAEIAEAAGLQGLDLARVERSEEHTP